jgi:hypothetical protein
MTNPIERTGALTVLSAEGPISSFPCTLSDLRAYSLLVLTNTQIRPGQLITVEYDDILFLGEARQCLMQDGRYITKVQISERITGLQSLMRLRSALLDLDRAYVPAEGNQGELSFYCSR